MKNSVYITFVALLTASCGARIGENIPGPSGTVMSEVKCVSSPAACFKKANAICKGPYQVLDSSSYAGGYITDIMRGPATWYKMSYQCGRTDGKVPSFPFRGPQYTPTITSCQKHGNSLTCGSI